MQPKAEIRKVDAARRPTGLLPICLPKLRNRCLVVVSLVFGACANFSEEPTSVEQIPVGRGVPTASRPPAENPPHPETLLVFDAETQEKVARLLEFVIGGNGSNRTEETSLVRNYTNAETALREASTLMPGRLDLRFGLASLLISEALQTNGTLLEGKVRQAMEVYEQIHSLDLAGFEAPLLYAGYARAIGDTNASQEAIATLRERHPHRTQGYLQKFDRADRVLQTTPKAEPRKVMPDDPHHVILVLGAGLETNGTVKPKLEARLQQALNLARMYLQAPIVLSGGNPKNGVTEAFAMRQWLATNAIPENRLILEDRARDTVGNALYSADILLSLGATHVTLVTSSSHVRRGLVDLQEACLQLGLKMEYDTLAASGGGDAPLDPEQERVGVYRDLMRVSGLWDLPGIRR